MNKTLFYSLYKRTRSMFENSDLAASGLPSAAELKLLERSEEHTSELQSLMRISYAVFCLKKKNIKTTNTTSLSLYKTLSQHHYNNIHKIITIHTKIVVNQNLTR